MVNSVQHGESTQHGRIVPLSILGHTFFMCESCSMSHYSSQHPLPPCIHFTYYCLQLYERLNFYKKQNSQNKLKLYLLLRNLMVKYYSFMKLDLYVLFYVIKYQMLPSTYKLLSTFDSQQKIILSAIFNICFTPTHCPPCSITESQPYTAQ